MLKKPETREEIATRVFKEELDAMFEYRPVFEDETAGLMDRFHAYLQLTAHGKKQYFRGKDMTNLSHLGRLLGRADTSIKGMLDAKRVDKKVFETILFLAAIYPGPAAGQSAHEARRRRLEVAAKWEAKGKQGELLELLREAHRQPVVREEV